MTASEKFSDLASFQMGPEKITLLLVTYLQVAKCKTLQLL